MDIDARIAKLAAAAAISPSPVEQELLRADVIVVAPHQTVHPGTSAPAAVYLAGGREAFFKRFRDQRTDLCAIYGHDRVEVPMNEVVAWRLAMALGDPWARLVPASVLRKIEDDHGLLVGGALMDKVHGEADAAKAVTSALDDVIAAGFWDALIGNQDRNLGNLRVSDAGLGLIDHGFSFGRPGDLINSATFVAVRHREGRASITNHERDALVELLDRDLHGLRQYLAPARANALGARAQSMLADGRVPRPAATVV